MRIALDARQLYRAKRRGIGRSTWAMYRALAHLHPDWQIVAIHEADRELAQSITQEMAGDLPTGFWQPHRLGAMGERLSLWERVAFPRLAHRIHADLIHTPSNYCPMWQPRPTVVTIHDTFPVDFAQTRPSGEVKKFKRWLEATRQAAMVICPSQDTAQSVMKHTNIDRRRISVCPHGHWPNPLTPDEAHTICVEMEIDKPFVLHLGGSAERKNTPGAIAAWKALPSEISQAYELLIVGADDKLQAQLQAMRDAGELPESVRVMGFVTEIQIQALQRSASALFFPTLAEGFGLPALEAFAAQTPLVSSNLASIPEVAGHPGDAAMLVDPTNIQTVADALSQVLTQDDLRQKLIERGTGRLNLFTWEKSAQAVSETFIRALSKHRARSYFDDPAKAEDLVS